MAGMLRCGQFVRGCYQHRLSDSKDGVNLVASFRGRTVPVPFIHGHRKQHSTSEHRPGILPDWAWAMISRPETIGLTALCAHQHTAPQVSVYQPVAAKAPRVAAAVRLTCWMAE